MNHHAVLITGAPAAGKSTLLEDLESRVSPVRTVEFGRLIAALLRSRGQDLSHSELRKQSAQVVSSRDVAELDAQVADDISEWLRESHVIIASHAVTHEQYGARVTAFSQETLVRLPLSAIVVLQAPPHVLVTRAKAKGKGRTWETMDEAERLQALQTTLALSYGMFCGCPVYVIDSDRSRQHTSDAVLGALQADGMLR
jgi:adenylate kinase